LDANRGHRQRVASTVDRSLRDRQPATPQVPAAARPAFVRYPIWVEDRAGAIAATQPDVVLGTWFTSVLQDAASPEHGGYQAGSCPRAEAAAQHLVNLPTHMRVTQRDAERIISRVAAAPLKRRRLRPGQMPSEPA